MREEKKLKQIISSFAKDNEKVLIIDRKENWNKWQEFKCLTPDDISILHDDSFDLVVVNDLTCTNIDFLKQLNRIGNKFIILSPFVTKITENSKQLIDEITKNELDEINFLDRISNTGEVSQKRKLEYVKLEKKDLLKIGSNKYFFNLALIQNLKTQIMEREKEIITKNKDITLFENRIRELEVYLDTSMEEIKRKEDAIKKQEKEFVEFKKQIDQEIQKRDQEIAKLNKQIDQEIQKKYQEIAKLNKQIDQEIIKLKKIEEDEKKELIFNFGQTLNQKDQQIRKLQEDFERRKKELEREKNRLIGEKDKKIRMLGKELEKLKSIGWYKLFSRISKFRY